MPWRRFVSFDVVAGLVWATYATMLGYVGGSTFEEDPLKGFLLASSSLSASPADRGASVVQEAACRR